MVTKSNKLSLSAEQELAISALLSGKTDEQAGKIAGVTRECVNRWKNRDLFFQAEYAGRRDEIWRSHKEYLQSLVSDALRTISEAVKNNPTIAMKILEKCQGLNVIEPPSGPTAVDGILLGVARERAQEELTEMRRKEGTGQLVFTDFFEDARELAPLIGKHYSRPKKRIWSAMSSSLPITKNRTGVQDTR